MRRFLWMSLVGLLLAAVPAAASTFLAMTQHELVAQSDAVVQGKVLKVSSFWSPSGRVIMSEALVQVECWPAIIRSSRRSSSSSLLPLSWSICWSI